MTQVALERQDRLSGVVIAWKTTRPFVENSRGVLIHRPRRVYVYRTKFGPHLAVHYWCGNGTNGTKNIAFLDEPPTDKLVCTYCEARAALAGLPASDVLAGRHVHLGKTVANQVCCWAGQET